MEIFTIACVGNQGTQSGRLMFDKHDRVEFEDECISYMHGWTKKEVLHFAKMRNDKWGKTNWIVSHGNVKKNPFLQPDPMTWFYWVHPWDGVRGPWKTEYESDKACKVATGHSNPLDAIGHGWTQVESEFNPFP